MQRQTTRRWIKAAVLSVGLAGALYVRAHLLLVWVVERCWDRWLGYGVGAALLAAGMWAGVRWARRLVRGEFALPIRVWGVAVSCLGFSVFNRAMQLHEAREAARMACVDSIAGFSIHMFAYAHEACVWGLWTTAGVLGWAALWGGGALSYRARSGRVVWSVVGVIVALTAGAAIALIAAVGADRWDILWAPVAALGVLGISHAVALARGRAKRWGAAARDGGVWGRWGVWITGSGAVGCAAYAACMMHELALLEVALAEAHPYAYSAAVQQALDQTPPNGALVWSLGVAVFGMGLVCAARARVSLRAVPRVGGRRLAWGVVVVGAVLGGPVLVWEHQLEAGLAIANQNTKRAGAMPVPAGLPEGTRLDGERAFELWDGFSDLYAMCWSEQGWSPCVASRPERGRPWDGSDWSIFLAVSADVPAHQIARAGWFGGAGDLYVYTRGHLEQVLPFEVPPQVVSVRMTWLMAPGHGFEHELALSRETRVAELMQRDRPLDADAISGALIEYDGVAWWIDGVRRVRLGRIDAPDILSKIHALGALPERVLVVVGGRWTVQDLVSVCLTLKANGAECALAQEPPEMLLERRGVHLSDAK